MTFLKALSTSHHKNLYKGCFYMFLAVFLFGVGNIFIKRATRAIPVTEIIFFRSLIGNVLILGYLIFTKNLKNLMPSNHKLQILRGGIGFIGLYMMYLSFELLPLTDATALSFATPLFVAILSIPLLKEKISRRRWAAIFIGFLGVVFMSQPSGHVKIMGIGVAILSAFLDAIMMIQARILSKKGSLPITTVFYYGFFLILISGVILPFIWVPFNTSVLIDLLFIAVLCSFGQIFLVTSYGLAPASVIAPIIYTLIIWGALFGYLVWDEKITEPLMIGIPVVILSGLYIIYEERKEKIPHTPEII